MEEISNKTLAILLIGAIVISLGGTLISLNRLARIRIPGITGFGITATLDVEIKDTTEVNWTTPAIDWGDGTVVIGKRCELNSYDASFDAANCTVTDGFSPDTDGLVLENTGNKNVSLNISTGKNAAAFIGGDSPVYQWNATELEGATTCAEDADFTVGTWYDSNSTSKKICTNFQCDNDHDRIQFDVKVEIPDDAFGVKSDTITATATGI